MLRDGASVWDNEKYRVEVAKTGRSRCKASKELIEKGELRFGSYADVMGHGSYQWRKLNHIGSRIAKNVRTKVGSWEHVSGFRELTPAEQEQFIIAMDSASAAAGGGRGKAVPLRAVAGRVAKAVAAAHAEGSSAAALPSPGGTAAGGGVAVAVAKDELEDLPLLPLMLKLGIPKRAAEPYAAVLGQKGFDCSAALHTLTEADLEEMGLLTGHRRLLLQHISGRGLTASPAASAKKP